MREKVNDHQFKILLIVKRILLVIIIGNLKRTDNFNTYVGVLRVKRPEILWGFIFCFITFYLASFQVDSLQRSLSDARENSGRLSSTIESLMKSHAELQEAMERLQTEMGQKDSEVNILRRDK